MRFFKTFLSEKDDLDVKFCYTLDSNWSTQRINNGGFYKEISDHSTNIREF